MINITILKKYVEYPDKFDFQKDELYFEKITDT